MPRNRSNDSTKKARQARENRSAAEAIMWDYIRAKKTGFKFRREHPIGPYRLDFYCAVARLAVEMDGEQHDAARDSVRDRYLESKGILTHRIPNRRFFRLDEEPYRNEVTAIIELCQSRINRPPST